MNIPNFTAREITIRPKHIHFYVPPITWKGDPVGHMGENDSFFWLVEGEVFLCIDKEYYLMKAGQLAFLPQGKFRKYTCLSGNFKLYTMSFHAEADNRNLMEGLGLFEENYVVNIENTEEMNRLFESSSWVEVHKDPINNVIWNANILHMIHTYAAARKEQNYLKDPRFIPVIEYIKNNLDKPLTIPELAEIVHMQPTYFIRRFKQIYGQAPMAYLKSFRVHKAMEMLLNTETNIEDIAVCLGINDAAYFSRWFKKSCGLSPSEYKKMLIN